MALTPFSRISFNSSILYFPGHHRSMTNPANFVSFCAKRKMAGLELTYLNTRYHTRMQKGIYKAPIEVSVSVLSQLVRYLSFLKVDIDSFFGPLVLIRSA